jgi:hypothetical protein
MGLGAPRQTGGGNRPRRVDSTSVRQLNSCIAGGSDLGLRRGRFKVPDALIASLFEPG